MFAVIREYFGRGEPAPVRGRGRRLLALFTFEFAVVVLGVLAAQLLQDWFAQRNEARRAKEAMTSFTQELGSFRAMAEYRIRADECETDRILRLGRLASSGSKAAPADLQPPIMPMPTFTLWSEDTISAVTRHSDSAYLKTYDATTLLARMISERQRRLEDQWADFRLLSPDAGPLTAEARMIVATAAARANGLLSAIDSNAYRLTQMLPRSKETGPMLTRLAAIDHPCAKAALVPYKPPAK